MGPHLKGAAPPFTPTGNASFVPASPPEPGRPGFQPRPAHAGIIARFAADAGYLERLLPRPLEPIERTSEVSLFVNQAVFRGSAVDLERVEPSEARFNELLIVIPCRYEGVEYGWHYMQYITNERMAYVSNYVGLWTKLAAIELMFPFPPEPLRAEVAAGALLKATASKLGDRLATVTFRAERQVEPAAVTTFDPRLVGMRYFPDFTTANRGNALVHDLVAFDLAEMAIEEAWAGEATVSFGRSEHEELYHLEPLRMLESYYVNGFSYVNRGIEVLHDYLA